MTTFKVIIYSGQSSTERMTITKTSRASGNFQSFSIQQTKEDSFQNGMIQNLYNMKEEPAINDLVEININGTNQFTGSIRSIRKDLIQQDSRDIKLIGKTYDLWREVVPSSNYIWGNDYTSNIISGMIGTHSSIGTSLIPNGSGQYISGNYSFKYWTLGDAVESISEYDTYRFFIDSGNNMHYYVPSGDQKTITESDLIKINDIRYDDSKIFNDIFVIGSGSIFAKASSQSSINSNGRYIKNIRDLNITKQSDANNLANKYLEEYSDPVLEGKITITGDETLDLEQYVTLSFSNMNVTGTHEIVGITHEFSTSQGFNTTLEFGRTAENPYRELKRINIDNTKQKQDLSDTKSTANSNKVRIDQDLPDLDKGKGITGRKAFISSNYYKNDTDEEVLVVADFKFELSGNTSANADIDIKVTPSPDTIIYKADGENIVAFEYNGSSVTKLADFDWSKDARDISPLPSGNYFAVADGEYGLNILNFSGKNFGLVASSNSLPGRKVIVNNDYIFLCAYNSGLKAYTFDYDTETLTLKDTIGAGSYNYNDIDNDGYDLFVATSAGARSYHFSSSLETLHAKDSIDTAHSMNCIAVGPNDCAYGGSSDAWVANRTDTSLSSSDNIDSGWSYIDMVWKSTDYFWAIAKGNQVQEFYDTDSPTGVIEENLWDSNARNIWKNNGKIFVATDDDIKWYTSATSPDGTFSSGSGSTTGDFSADEDTQIPISNISINGSSSAISQTRQITLSVQPGLSYWWEFNNLVSGSVVAHRSIMKTGVSQ